MGGELRNNKDKKVDLFERIRKGKAIYAEELGKKGVSLLGLAPEDNFGRSALTYAAIYDNPEAARVLLDHFNDNEKAAFYIKEDGKTKKARDVFINTPDVLNETTPLMYAAQYGSVGVAKMLLDDKFIRLDQGDKFGRTALMYAAAFGSNDIVKAIVEKDPASVNSVDKYGHTAFYYAAQNNDSVDVLDLLAKDKGFDPEACSCSSRKANKHLRKQGGLCAKG